MEWYDFLNPNEQKEFECTECGTSIESEGVCSRDCFNASML